jgi:acyl-CoA reductase LuxC
MLQNFSNNNTYEILKNMKYVVGNYDVLIKMLETPANQIFSDQIIKFLDDLSKVILYNKQSKNYPDVTTFAFWCRKASTMKMKHSFQVKFGSENGYRLGRGIAFHIAPSNVAVNFAYSMVAGLLAGNSNIVRLPSNDFVQVDIICNAINITLEKNPELKSYFIMVKYGHVNEINDALSFLCDTRVIWGGNQTISTIRQSALKPRSTEVCFSDRYSISIINSEAYLENKNKKIISEKFYNDTYLNDQNACTSPKLIVWMGNRVNVAKEIFWNELHEYIVLKYELQAVQSVDKLNALYKFGATKNEIYNGKLVSTKDNLITRVKIDKISEDLMDSCCNSGFFFEYTADNLSEILPICKSELQTIGVLGVSKELIFSFIKANRPKGIDRIVMIGDTLNFDLVWDGYDLISQMSRLISINYD